jgi:hypothetical protein
MSLTIVSSYIPANNEWWDGCYKMDGISISVDRVKELLGPSIDGDKTDNQWIGYIDLSGRKFKVMCWFHKNGPTLTLWAETLEAHDAFKSLLEG